MGAYRIYNGLTKTAPFDGYPGDIVQYPLRHEAATAWASGILPPAFVSAVDFSAGAWTAPLPEGTPEEVANRFTQGVLPEPPTSTWKPFDPNHFGKEMSERLAKPFGCAPTDMIVVPKRSLVLFAAQWAVDHLRSSRSALALIREMHPRSDATRIIWSSALGDLYPVSGRRLDRDAVADVMNRAAGVNEELLILTSSDRQDPAATLTLLDGDLAGLVARADSIALGAYDGEGYVRWSRTRIA